jgi:hypothetical protein
MTTIIDDPTSRDNRKGEPVASNGVFTRRFQTMGIYVPDQVAFCDSTRMGYALALAGVDLH